MYLLGEKNSQEKYYLVLFLVVCSLAAAHQKILNEHKWQPNFVIYSEKEKTYQMLKHYRENQMANKKIESLYVLHISLFRSVKLLRISIFPRITFFDLSLVTVTQNVALCRGQVFTACVRSILCSLYI